MDKADVNDLSSLAAAYATVEDAAAPSFWTPAHVQLRMVEAFTVIANTVGRVGPKTYGAAWPSILREFADYVGYDDAQYKKDRRAEILREADQMVSSTELSRADEAMGWAARYLQADPVLADAIQLWAYCKARNVKIEKVLRARRVAADRLRVQMCREVDAIHAAHAARRRREIAATFAQWANDRLAKAPDIGYAARIRAGARELARKAIIKGERADPRPSTKMRRSEAMPGRVFTNQWLDMKRKEAAAVLAARLDEDGVVVR